MRFVLVLVVLAALLLLLNSGGGANQGFYKLKYVNVTYLDTGEELSWYSLGDPSEWVIPVKPNQLVHIKVESWQSFEASMPANECLRVKGTVQSWGKITGAIHAPVQVLRDPSSTRFHILVETPSFDQLRTVLNSGNITLLDYGIPSDSMTITLNSSTHHVRTFPIERNGFNFYADFSTDALHLRGRH